jgi:hypothetical protein
MCLTRKLVMQFMIAGLCATCGMVYAKEPGKDKPLLSEVPHLQNLLRQEMQAVLPAMNKIVTALPTGEWHTVATTAEAIHNSFIMQQKLTAKDRELLHRHLPAEFVHLDQAFHQQASKLQRAAEQRDAELSVFYVQKMLGSCMECHQRFAMPRFPELQQKMQPTHHH